MEYFKSIDHKIEKRISILVEKSRKYPILKTIGLIYLILTAINIIPIILQW